MSKELKIRVGVYFFQKTSMQKQEAINSKIVKVLAAGGIAKQKICVNALHNQKYYQSIQA